MQSTVFCLRFDTKMIKQKEEEKNLEICITGLIAQSKTMFDKDKERDRIFTRIEELSKEYYTMTGRCYRFPPY